MKSILLNNRIQVIVVFVLGLFFCSPTQAQADPTVAWAQQFGGTFNLGWHVFDSDNSGNTYTTGRFSGTVSFGDITLSSVGSSDIFVVKTNSSGLVLWAERFGGGGEDFGVAITTDNLGNIYTTGSFNGTASFGSYTFTSNTNERSIYVVKQNTSGQVLWATQFSSPWTTIPQDFLSIGI